MKTILRNKIFLFALFFVVLATSASFVSAASEWTTTPCNLPVIGGPDQRVCDALPGQDTDFCSNNVALSLHFQCNLKLTNYYCWRQEMPKTEGDCNAIINRKCSADEKFVLGDKQKCVVENKTAKCVFDKSITEKTCEGPGTECVNNTTVRSYYEKCVNPGVPGAIVDCRKFYRGQLPTPVIPEDVFCPGKNYGICTGKHWQNVTYKCGTNSTTPKPSCVLDKTDGGDCNQGKAKCDPAKIRIYEREIFDDQTCVVTPDPKKTPNSASCDPPNPGSRWEPCGTDGWMCTGDNPFTAHAYKRKCRTTSPTTAICEIPTDPNQRVEDTGFPQECKSESKECKGDVLETTLREACTAREPNPPPNDSTKGKCFAQNPPTVTEDCSTKALYTCENKPSATPPFFEGFKQKGGCDPNKKECVPSADAPKEKVLTCSGAMKPWQPEEIQCGAGNTAIVQKMGNDECTLPNGPDNDPKCQLVRPRFEIKQECPTLGGATVCTKIDICGTGTASGGGTCDPSCFGNCMSLPIGDKINCMRQCCAEGKGSGDTVNPLKICQGCREPGGSPSCDAWQEQLPGIPCGPPSESTTTYCTPGANSVQCTLTASYSGKCIDPANFGNAECEPPKIEVVCSGPCGTDTDGDGIPDDVDTDDDNDGVPDGQDPDPKDPNNPGGDPPPPPPPPCESKVCPDGTSVGCNDNCPNPPNPPPPPPCTETCSDGSKAPCGNCPPCKTNCSDGTQVNCDQQCPQPPLPPDPPPPPPPGNFCNENKVCQAGINGKIKCSGSADCESTCSKNYKCEPGGGGAVCKNSADCLFQKTKCVLENGAKICRPDLEGGKDCETDSDCKNENLYCDSTAEQCVPGGDTGTPCQDDFACQYGCNDDLQCVFGGIGGMCSPYNNECSTEEFTCNADRQCVPDECGGASCNPANGDNDCSVDELPEMYCDSACQRCVPGGDTGILCQDDFICQIDFPKVKNLTAAQMQCPGFLPEGAKGAVYFQWEYEDNENFPKGNFELEIDNDPDFDSPDSLPEVRLGFPTAVTQQLVYIKTNSDYECPLCQYLNYEGAYYWRVRTAWHEWIYYDGGEGTNDPDQAVLYTISGHPDPIAMFDYAVLKNAAVFEDQSQCFDAEGNQELCGNWIWDFGDNRNSNVQNPSHIYQWAQNSYNVNMTVCDNLGACCLAPAQTVSREGDNFDLRGRPKWKEISPF